MILAPKYRNERDYLLAVTAANTLDGCSCWPVVIKDDAIDRYDMLHLPLCEWRGPHPLTQPQCAN